MKNFKKLSMYDENIETTSSNSTDPLLGLGVVMKRISHFDTLDGGTSYGNGIKDLKFHCTLNCEFQPDKFYVTWLDGEVEEVKPIYALF